MRPQAFVKPFGKKFGVLDVKWKEIANYQAGDKLSDISVTYTADQLAEEGSQIALASEVTLLGGRVLRLYDSLITKPVYVLRESDELPATFRPDKLERISVSYNPGQNMSALVCRPVLKY
jgi:hypothetical protein